MKYDVLTLCCNINWNLKPIGKKSKELLQSRQDFQKDFVKIEEQTASIILNLRAEEARELEALQDEINAKEI